LAYQYVVLVPFSGHSIGEVISDPDAVAAILGTAAERNVVRVGVPDGAKHLITQGEFNPMSWFDLSATVGTSTTTLVPADPGITKLRIQNNSLIASVALGFGGATPALNAPGSFTLGPGAVLSEDAPEVGAISIVASAAGTPVTCRVANYSGLNPFYISGVNGLVDKYRIAGSFFDPNTTNPASYSGAILALYKAFYDAGVAQNIAAFYLLAAQDTGASALNWFGSANLTFLGAPGFVKGLGRSFLAASTQYATTGFVPSSDSRVTANSHTLLTWTDSANTVAGGNNPAASSGDFEIVPKRTTGTFGVKSTTAAQDAITRTVYGGMHGFSRTDPASYRAYEGATEIVTATVSDGSLIGDMLLVGARPSDANGTPTANTYYTGTISAVLVGAGMTTAQIAAINVAVTAYLATVAGL
jgi:hypothetical protein